MKYLSTILFLCLLALRSYSTPINIKELNPGELKVIAWNGLPVFIYKRSDDEIKRIKNKGVYFNKSKYFNILSQTAQNYGNRFASDLSHGGSSLESLSIRSIREDVFISLGISTYFQCAIKHNAERGLLYDPCSKTEYDMDGRILNPNNRENYHLLIPPHFYKGNEIHIGSENNASIPFVDFSPNIEEMNISNDEKLIKALLWNKSELVISLLKTNVNTSYETQTGATAFHIAAERSSPKIIKALLKYGFDINHISKKGVTPLQIALFIQNDESSRVLLMEGAETNKFCNKERCAKSAFSFLKQIDDSLTETEFSSIVENLQTDNITNKAIQGINP